MQRHNQLNKVAQYKTSVVGSYFWSTIPYVVYCGRARHERDTLHCSSEYLYRFTRKDAAATIYFSTTAMRRLFEGAAYSREVFLIPLRVLTCNLVPSTFTRQFPADAMTDHEEFVFVCSFMCTRLATVLGSLS